MVATVRVSFRIDKDLVLGLTRISMGVLSECKLYATCAQHSTVHQHILGLCGRCAFAKSLCVLLFLIVVIWCIHYSYCHSILAFVAPARAYLHFGSSDN